MAPPAAPAACMSCALCHGAVCSHCATDEPQDMPGLPQLPPGMQCHILRHQSDRTILPEELHSTQGLEGVPFVCVRACVCVCVCVVRLPHGRWPCSHAVLCCAVLCCAVLCCAVLCCAVLCCAVLCLTSSCVQQAFLKLDVPPGSLAATFSSTLCAQPCRAARIMLTELRRPPLLSRPVPCRRAGRHAARAAAAACAARARARGRDG
jgi:hypothetical protein